MMKTEGEQPPLSQRETHHRPGHRSSLYLLIYECVFGDPRLQRSLIGGVVAFARPDCNWNASRLNRRLHRGAPDSTGSC